MHLIQIQLLPTLVELLNLAWLWLLEITIIIIISKVEPKYKKVVAFIPLLKRDQSFQDPKKSERLICSSY